jgi:hypothetical protein
MMAGASATSFQFGLSWAVGSDLISFLKSRQIGHVVEAGLHLVTSHFQMLTGIMVDVMQPTHESCHVVGR